MGSDPKGWWDTCDTLTLVIKHGWPANPILNGNIMCRESVQIFVVDFPWSCLSKKNIHRVSGFCFPMDQENQMWLKEETA